MNFTAIISPNLTVLIDSEFKHFASWIGHRSFCVCVWPVSINYRCYTGHAGRRGGVHGLCRFHGRLNIVTISGDPFIYDVGLCKYIESHRLLRRETTAACMYAYRPITYITCTLYIHVCTYIYKTYRTLHNILHIIFKIYEYYFRSIPWWEITFEFL